MKILVFSQYFWPETFAINSLVPLLRERGAEIVVLTGQPNYPAGKIFPSYTAWKTRRERIDETDILRVPLFPRGCRSPWRLALNYLSFVVSAAVFGPWLLRDRRFDVIFVYAPSPLLQALPALWLARLRGVPLAVWVQDLWPESLSATGFVKNRSLLAIVTAIVRFIYRCSDAILIQSRAFQAPVRRLVDKPEKVHYYPNMANLPEGMPPTPQAVAAAAEISDSFSVVFAGNLGVAQSLETVVEAAEHLCEHSHIRFYLIGSGSCDKWLNQEISRRGLKNVFTLGRFAPQDMSSLLSAATVLLVTLRNEAIFDYTIPSKVQAYLATGRPVIASLNGEGARIIEEAGAGITCAAGDAKELADAVLKLYAMSATDRDALGAAGRAYFMEHFESGKLADQLLNLLNCVIPPGEKQ